LVAPKNETSRREEREVDREIEGGRKTDSKREREREITYGERKEWREIEKERDMKSRG